MFELRHKPVLLTEVMNILHPLPGETVIDVTLGLGGHASAFMKAVGANGRLIGLDADEDNLHRAREIIQGSNVTLIHANFRDLATLSLPSVDILFADLGVSSPHFDDPSRGFSFRADGPLDLRFDRSRGMTADEMIRESSEAELVYIFSRFGELPRSKTLGARLYSYVRRSPKPLRTTDLRLLVEELYGYHAKDTLPQVFQALRMAVNDEVGALEELLKIGQTMLKTGGRTGIISFHSLEDRMVKDVFRSLATVEKDSLTGAPIGEAPFEVLTKKPVVPTRDEVHANPRSRSAKFRAVRRMSGYRD